MNFGKIVDMVMKTFKKFVRLLTTFDG